jgi:hypothetical protein
MQKRPILGLSKPLKAPLAGLATIDFRVTWNEATAAWDVKRNGVDIHASRRKRQSAIDLAIRKAQAEAATSQAKIIVTSLENGKAKTEWPLPAGPGKGLP